MIHELKSPESQETQPLFAPFSFHASCAAVLNGTNPGRILVDDPLDATAGFVLSPEAAYLSGDADNMAFCRSLGSYLRDLKNLGVAIWHLEFVVSSDRWRHRLDEIARAGEVVSTSRRHYLCSNVDDVRPLPRPEEGVTIRPIDQALLDSGTFSLPNHIVSWIGNNWGSRSHFLSAGFGVVAICGGEIVSWSVADCRAGGHLRDRHSDSAGVEAAGYGIVHCQRRSSARVLQWFAARGLALSGRERRVSAHRRESRIQCREEVQHLQNPRTKG